MNTDCIIHNHEKATRSVLLEHPLQNAPLLLSLATGAWDKLYLFNNTVAIQKGDFLQLATDFDADLGILLGGIDKESINLICCVNEDSAELLTSHFHFSAPEAYYQFALDVPCKPFDCPFALRPIGPEQLDFVCTHYTRFEPGEEDYLKSRLASGHAFGAFDGDAIIGFIFTHEEMSMGGLEVLPAYRGKGVGAALESHLQHHLIEMGLPWTYCHVALDNKPSLQLQWKLGMTLADNNVLWMHRVENAEDEEDEQEDKSPFDFGADFDADIDEDFDDTDWDAPEQPEDEDDMQDEEEEGHLTDESDEFSADGCESDWYGWETLTIGQLQNTHPQQTDDGDDHCQHTHSGSCKHTCSNESGDDDCGESSCDEDSCGCGHHHSTEIF